MAAQLTENLTIAHRVAGVFSAWPSTNLDFKELV